MTTVLGQILLGFAHQFWRILEELGEFALFSRQVLMRVPHASVRSISHQIIAVTERSLLTVAFSGLFVGGILALQFSAILDQYGALSILGGLNTSATVRQVGPLIISFLLAGKVGAFTAAELGTMRVTEQIDAIECLGTDPLEFLVVPRFLGIVVASLILLIFGLFVSVGGSMAVARVLFDINPLEFLSSIPRFTALSTLVGAVIQSLVYGMIVAGVACNKGFNATSGARGVGHAVTQAAIYTNIFIVIANYVLTTLLVGISGASQ